MWWQNAKVTVFSMMFFFVASSCFGIAEEKAMPEMEKAKKQVMQHTKTDKLLQFSEERSARYKREKSKAIKIAQKRGLPIKTDEMEVQNVIDNRLLYYHTCNAIAADSVSTDEVWSGGSVGLSLDGTGTVCGIWDSGDVRITHQEFNNTGTSRVIDRDGTGGLSNHSTHVAGTICSGGIDPNTKGMAHNALLHAYDWNDDYAEMAAAAAKGLLISNHSYGYLSGWMWYSEYGWVWFGNPDISLVEDWWFGFYDELTAEIDQMAYDAPYYLIVKSVGNDCGEGPDDGPYPKDGGSEGYDCIPIVDTAKNILTVGAVYDIPGGYTDPNSVVIMYFSNCGPTDDGRIKPDIVGNGDQLLSAGGYSDSDSCSISGTSMSSPNISGSLLLLQQHYRELKNQYMRAATLKALALHTADEAGLYPGPDYKFGWGLLNTQKATDLITNIGRTSIISEEIYAASSPYSIAVTASGTESLIVTVVWTDLPGTPVEMMLDPPDPMLVNDLDVTVSDGLSTYYPYLLNKDEPSAPATTGNNNVDNVEKVVIQNPTKGGIYTVNVGHEGFISGGSQNFSIVISGLKEKFPWGMFLPAILNGKK